MHRVEERVQIPFVAASSLAHLGERTIPDCGPFGYTVERYGRTNTYYAYTKNACTNHVHRGGRENRNNNDNNDHDDNIGSKIHRRERRGEGEIRAVNLGFPEATKRYLALPVF